MFQTPIYSSDVFENKSESKALIAIATRNFRKFSQQLSGLSRSRIISMSNEPTNQRLSLQDKLKRIDNDHKSGVVNMDRTIMRDYMRAAQELWNVFYSTRAFYPNNRVCYNYLSPKRVINIFVV